MLIGYLKNAKSAKEIALTKIMMKKTNVLIMMKIYLKNRQIVHLWMIMQYKESNKRQVFLIEDYLKINCKVY